MEDRNFKIYENCENWWPYCIFPKNEIFTLKFPISATCMPNFIKIGRILSEILKIVILKITENGKIGDHIGFFHKLKYSL